MRSIIILCVITLTFASAMWLGISWLRDPAPDSGHQKMPLPQSLKGAITDYSFQLPYILAGKQSYFDFREAHGRVTVVNFWATWCEPCQREFPTLLKLAQKLDSNFMLILISVDSDRKDIDHFFKAFDPSGSHAVLLWDARSEVAGRYGTYQLPESYIFDRDGVLKQKITGYEDWTSEKITGYLNSLAKIN